MKNTLTIMFIAVALLLFGCEKEESSMTNQKPSTTPENLDSYPAATFAGGCFWGVEYNFRRVPGVVDTAVGFMGGKTQNPTYKEICYDDTNHAEVVHLRYDPVKVTYEQLVKIFFVMHDPTTMNRQGLDVGDQYRSAIFYETPEQKEIADKVKTQLNASGEFKRTIVTEITAADEFWKAEDYHQQYIEKNPLRRCHVVDFDEIKKILNN